jgi:hypothetical protein
MGDRESVMGEGRRKAKKLKSGNLGAEIAESRVESRRLARKGEWRKSGITEDVG